MEKFMNSSVNVIIYCRVSTDEQAQKGFSLDYQEESLKRYCDSRSYNIVKVYREDHSAKNFNRPEWSKLKTYVKSNKKEIHKVLFAKWDRFSRNVEQALTVLREFDSIGVELNASEQYLDTSNSDNKMVLAIYLTAGEVERDKISSRTIAGTYQAKKDGYFVGKAPFGYDNFRDELKKSTLKPNEHAGLVKRAFKEVAMGIEPVETIRKKLRQDGMELKKSAFSELLKNIVYIGKIRVPEFKKESAMIVDGKHEALIDLETFNKVQNVFKGKRWHGIKPSHKNHDFPMRDFLTCKICGSQITGSNSKGRTKRYAYYHCRNKCKTRVSVDDAHLKIASILSGLQINENIKELFVDVLKDSESQINGDKSNQLEIKLEAQRALKAQIEKAEDKLMSDDISTERFESIIERINGNLSVVNNEIEILSAKTDSIKTYVDSGLELLANLDKLFLNADYDGKRIVAGAIFTQKLLFGNDDCRTTQVNEVINVLTRNSKGSERLKKEKAVKNDSFSVKVPGAGVEPARFPTGV
ncbi:recombinase family protein [Flavobacterium ginsengisoli]|uniref:Recombinase family protein n=2 Tax=Flavobacterium ginsengisoli TaxID=871694 RepID=A0ABP7ESU4_9FLAO